MSKPLWERLKCAVTREAAREEMRTRIILMVNSKSPISDMALWRESGPDFLPWKFMLEELWKMHDEGKVLLEIVSPGNWILHSTEKLEPVTKKKVRKKRKEAAVV